MKPGLGYRIASQGPNGTVLEITGVGGSNSGQVQQFKFKSYQGDHIVCNTWDGVNLGTDDILIAKPWELRHSILKEFIGTTEITYSAHSTANQSRYADDGTNEYTQYVVPRYLPGSADPVTTASTIFAARVAHTGVTVDGVELTWIDLNTGGRAWAKETA